jgi:hypothetical protein
MVFRLSAAIGLAGSLVLGISIAQAGMIDDIKHLRMPNFMPGHILEKAQKPGHLDPVWDSNGDGTGGASSGPIDSCVDAGSRISLSESQFFLCNRSGTSLKFELLVTSNGDGVAYELNHGEYRIFDIASGRTATGSITTNGTKKSYLLTPQKKYSLESENDLWVFAEL